MIRRKVRTSRLNRTSERQNKKQALIFSIGIIIVIGVLLQFGPLLVNVFGNVVYTIRGGDSQDTQKIEEKTLIQPPTLFDIPTATQSSRIHFRGTSQTDSGTVEIYLNDELEDEIELDDTSFEVKDFFLKKGTNLIKARLVQDEVTSPFSDEYEVSYVTDKPKLEIASPSDGQGFSKADKNINVSGTTDPDNTVTVNSFRAIVEPSGKFNYLLQLNDGENIISIEAKNQAGTTDSIQLRVNYTP